MNDSSKNKSNKKFMLLSFFGIIMVVSGHILDSYPIRFFDNYFPINSFFMPMFIFISGYFFSDKKIETFSLIKTNIFKKFKNLLVYYILWNIFYGIINIIIYLIGITPYYTPLNIKTIFIIPFIDGQQFSFNAPAWFLLTLFEVEIIFIFYRKIFEFIKLKYKSIVSFVILIFLNFITVYIMNNYNINQCYLVILKPMFFLIFYNLGYYYKLYYEKIDIKIPAYLILSLLIIINGIILTFYDNINFSGLYALNNFHDTDIFIPFLTGITGIYFFVKLSGVLEKSLGESKIINLISNSTKAICTHHIFCMYLFTFILYIINKKIILIPGFDNNSFENLRGWYFYTSNNNFLGYIYLLIGLFGSIVFEKYINIIYNNVRRRIANEKCKKSNGSNSYL